MVEGIQFIKKRFIPLLEQAYQPLYETSNICLSRSQHIHLNQNRTTHEE
jgi:hypothetical protein